MHRGVKDRGLVLEVTELADHLPHVLCLIAISHQHRVAGVHDHEIFETHGCHQAVFTLYEAIPGTDQHGFPPDAVAHLIGLIQFRDRFPGADIAPAEVRRNHRGVGRAFHHRIVDGNGRTLREGFGRHFEGIAVRIHAFKDGGYCLGNFRCMRRQGVQERIDPEAKHA